MRVKEKAMLGKIECVMMLLIFPMIMFAAAFLGSAIDHDSLIALFIGIALIVLSAFNFAFVMVCSYLESQVKN